MTPSGATKVYKFLNTQSTDQATYASNPLWKVVDGPWNLSAFSPSTGYAAFVPNPTYGGPGKPKIAKVEELPFTSDIAEFDALRSGQLDYGYLPSEDINQARSLTSRGYTIDKWTDFGFNDFFLNFTNPQVGPIFKQLYVRQAMQHLINQPEIANDIFHGAAYPDYGPVPTVPPNPYSTQQMKTNPYPYSVSAAKSLLASHGWTVRPGGSLHLRPARDRLERVRGRDRRRREAQLQRARRHGVGPLHGRDGDDAVQLVACRNPGDAPPGVTRGHLLEPVSVQERQLRLRLADGQLRRAWRNAHVFA